MKSHGVATCRGLTLLEVTAALLILSISIFFMLHAEGLAVRNAGRIKRLARAHAAAESVMDEFLASPDFVPFDLHFDRQEDVVLPGYEDTSLRVTRIITERDPFMEQETMEVVTDSEEDQLYSYLLPADEEEEEEEFDPGIFVAVRVEARDPEVSEDPLVVLETWLPKPPVDEDEDTTREKPEATTMQSAEDAGGTR